MVRVTFGLFSEGIDSMDAIFDVDVGVVVDDVVDKVVDVRQSTIINSSTTG